MFDQFLILLSKFVIFLSFDKFTTSFKNLKDSLLIVVSELDVRNLHWLEFQTILFSL